ncbi:hypothetical protein C6Y14_03270 [Streptomyces dioscori]|uniref:Uncharacterized protein n=1 Tax=Streptomyces dioscori TaxID=2109333 RepID=A0A2P8QFT2_9ACTN|nr:hypothetical protein [Streptomyces dioscori]PSM45113.1 hypothetical protein C6Y14_03270 [Streptomyces dioscori]
MLRKFIAAVAVTIGISLAGAGIATAATSAAVERVRPTAEVSAAAVWRTIGYYETLSECQARGKLYVALGWAKAWACDDVGAWRLRVLD